jgi:HPt (histidine-containing phosphotransfer) domain-containing protein
MILTMEYRYINPEYLESVAGGDVEIIRELSEIFLSQITEFSIEMRSLYEKKDYFNLGLLAHKAKSSVAIMGMADLAALLKTFELEAKAGINSERYATNIERFESETKKAAIELSAYLKTH